MPDMCFSRWARVVTFASLLLAVLSAFQRLDVSAGTGTVGTGVSENLYNDMVLRNQERFISENRALFSKEAIRNVSCLKSALKFFDIDFFGDPEVKEMAMGEEEHNIPAFRVNRKLVASVNGGLRDPSVLVFNPESRRTNELPTKMGGFDYPKSFGVRRPGKEDDIAYMSVLELGELIRKKQITSQELTDIFLQRLKRHGRVLEAVVSYTEELAYSQAKKADELLGQGVYLSKLAINLNHGIIVCHVNIHI